MKKASWRCKISVLKVFQIPRGTTRRSLSLVKLKTSPSFLKVNSTPDIYSEFCKIFLTTISREALLLKCFARDHCFLLVWLVLLFCETDLITRKRVFRRNIWWSVGTEHLAVTAWKKKLFNCTYSVSSLCTGAEDCNINYLKLWVQNNLEYIVITEI